MTNARLACVCISYRDETVDCYLLACYRLTIFFRSFRSHLFAACASVGIAQNLKVSLFVHNLVARCISFCHQPNKIVRHHPKLTQSTLNGCQNTNNNNKQTHAVQEL